MVIAIEEVVRTFAMPGTGIIDFDKHSAAIAQAGIYDATILHEQVFVPVILNHWRVQHLERLVRRRRAGPREVAQAHRAARQPRPRSSPPGPSAALPPRHPRLTRPTGPTVADRAGADRRRAYASAR